MSEPVEEKSSEPSDALNAGIHLGESLDNVLTEKDPTINTPSQILLEALKNFVIPLIHAVDEKNKKDINQVYLGLEAGKLLNALQEFVSLMIVQSRISQPQRTEMDLEAPVVEDVPLDKVEAESPGVAKDSAVSHPGLSEAPNIDDVTDDSAAKIDTTSSEPELLKEDPPEAETPSAETFNTSSELELSEGFPSFMGRLQEKLREHVFSKMPIRLLYFTDILQGSGTKIQITLLDRNGVYDRIIERIQASEGILKETIKNSNPEQNNDFIQQLVLQCTRYTILSHTWLRGLDGEVTYDRWQTGKFDTQQPGYQKLSNFCKSTWKDHRLAFGWMDTICINKDSSSELDESIRSMYKWYQSSDICITYLAATLTLDNIHRDPWFTRGWTLQELLAPDRMAFYNKDWKPLVPGPWLNKFDAGILNQIYEATTITKYELRYPNDIPISRKMQLAAKRKVMREEDAAYSLMGVCNASISIAYGEGAERAFLRLLKEILSTSREVVDIFNCAQTEGFLGRSIIPLTPSQYLGCSEDIMRMKHYPPIEPLLLTHVGLRMPILLMPALREDDPCLECSSIGDYYAMLQIPTLYLHNITYHLLDKGVVTSTIHRRMAFGILNFGGDKRDIFIPDRCLAVCFSWAGQVEWDSTSLDIEIVSTKEPIVFPLRNRRTRFTSEDGQDFYLLKRSALAMHGMTLTTLYL